MTCPNCGGELEAISMPFTPPWLCPACSLAWWNAELTDQARAAWRPRYRDFGGVSGAPQEIAAAVAAEQAGG